MRSIFIKYGRFSYTILCSSLSQQANYHLTLFVHEPDKRLDQYNSLPKHILHLSYLDHHDQYPRPPKPNYYFPICTDCLTQSQLLLKGNHTIQFLHMKLPL